MMEALIWIVDFGSQYTQLITRKSRELGYSSYIFTLEEIEGKIKKGESPSCLILSGGPNSVYSDHYDYSSLLSLQCPILGICYGMQLLAKHFGGEVERGITGEYGHTMLHRKNDFVLKSCPEEINVWMSHADHVAKLPPGFITIWESHNLVVAGMKHQNRPIMGLQFHPEVEHTEWGREILLHFYQEVAGLTKDWNPECMLQECSKELERIAAEKHYVLCAFSGGVDSLVAAKMASRHFGDRLYCFFVDHGLLRQQDYAHIEEMRAQAGMQIEIIKCDQLFMQKLAGVVDPEEKRKIIGKTFIEVFEQKVHEFERDHNIEFQYLLQGTLYPDVIESKTPHKDFGKSHTIKSHHNVGGLPETMRLALLEPLKYLFKDEVRKLGALLELPEEWVHRHPFPGPGLGIRIMGEITAASLLKVRQSDQILFEELHFAQLYTSVWQAFTVFLPVKTVGVKGDARAYEEVICLRMVDSVDAMTASISNISYSFLSKVSSRITNEVSGITRVVYDITSKPPGTIEWE